MARVYFVVSLERERIGIARACDVENTKIVPTFAYVRTVYIYIYVHPGETRRINLSRTINHKTECQLVPYIIVIHWRARAAASEMYIYVKYKPSSGNLVF